MRGILRLLLISIVIAALYNCSKIQPPAVPKDDPDGFRGIKWGTSIKDIKGMNIVEKREDSNFPHITYNLFKRREDKLELGLVKLDDIHYWFWNGKLAKVTVEASGGQTTFNSMKDVCFKKFGSGKYYKSGSSDSSRPKHSYLWEGKKTNIDLSFYEWGGTIIWLSSEEIKREQREYLSRKVKEGVEKGF